MKLAVPLEENILAQLEIIAAASAVNARMQKKTHGSGTTNLIVLNNKMNDIIEIVQTLAGFNILQKGVTEAIKNKIKEQKEGFLGMLLGTLRASLLENILAGKGIVRAGCGNKMEF